MKLCILGSPTLKRYTEGILSRGFSQLGWQLTDTVTEAKHAIFQIHGAPNSRSEDERILEVIHAYAKDLPSAVILLHRPDEIRDSFPQFFEKLSALPKTLGLVMLGDLLLEDAKYSSLPLEKKVIPHGFFDDIPSQEQKDIIIGSHTTWGEMRSLGLALKLLDLTLSELEDTSIISYLGGGPADHVSQEVFECFTNAMGLENSMEFRRIDEGADTLWAFNDEGDRIVYYSNLATNPLKQDFTFHFQLYHLGSSVRLGESSGSLHSSMGIPVIIEANGAERLENLQVVKVPYQDSLDLKKVNLEDAAQEITRLIKTLEYKNMLSHNKLSALRNAPKNIAESYAAFFEELLLK